MKRSFVFLSLCFGILAAGLGYTAVAKLYSPFRDGFHARPGDAGEAFDVQIGQKICGNAVNYKFLDFQYPYGHQQNEPAHLDFVMERYHYRTNCLINDAMNTAIKQVNDTLKESLGGEDVDALTEYEDKIEVCEDIRLHTIQTAQKDKKALLDDGKSMFDEGADANKARYSLEDVRRTLLRESCGYHLYLETLKEDSEGFAYEFKAQNGTLDGLKFEDFDRATVARHALIEEEIRQSEVALNATLDFYAQFLSHYRLNGALEANIQRIEEINQDFSTLGKKIEKLTDQLPSSTSYICPQ